MPERHEMKPGRWWRVIDAEGALWCETSNEAEARANVRDGDRLENLHVCERRDWREVELDG